MTYSVNEIIERLSSDTEAFIRECEKNYADKVAAAAKVIAANLDRSRIVFLAGPSGSGKTTTAIKLDEELEKHGLTAKSISMDYYFITEEDYPRTENGDYDYESPYCLDFDLLFEHFEKIEKKEPIRIPRYDFANGRRAGEYEDYCVGENEVVIFEGLHALNSLFSDRDKNAVKLYVGVGSEISCDGGVFRPDMVRLVRRTVRDNKYRGASAEFTLYVWNNVMEGERRNIAPFRQCADVEIDSLIPYEPAILKKYVLPLYEKVPHDELYAGERYEVEKLLRAIPDLPDELVPADSLVREFIGDSVYSY